MHPKRVTLAEIILKRGSFLRFMKKFKKAADLWKVKVLKNIKNIA